MARPPRLLIVEPNRSALRSWPSGWAKRGYRIVACDNAGNARPKCFARRSTWCWPSCGWTSVSGIELTRRIRDDTVLGYPGDPHHRRSDSAGAVDGFAAGADDVVAKPFHFEVLAARIARRIARARSVKELRADNATLDARVLPARSSWGNPRGACSRAKQNGSACISWSAA